jgi:hypothetical protein
VPSGDQPAAHVHGTRLGFEDAKRSAVGVLSVQFGFEQVHGLGEALLLARGALVQDAGQRLGGRRKNRLVP